MKIKAKEKVIPSNDDSDGRMSTLPIMQVKSKVHQNNKYYVIQIVLRNSKLKLNIEICKNAIFDLVFIWN